MDKPTFFKSLHAKLNSSLEQTWTELVDDFDQREGRDLARLGNLLAADDTELLIDAMKMDPQIAEAVYAMASVGYHEAWKRSMERKDPALA